MCLEALIANLKPFILPQLNPLHNAIPLPRLDSFLIIVTFSFKICILFYTLYIISNHSILAIFVVWTLRKFNLLLSKHSQNSDIKFLFRWLFLSTRYTVALQFCLDNYYFSYEYNNFFYYRVVSNFIKKQRIHWDYNIHRYDERPSQKEPKEISISRWE